MRKIVWVMAAGCISLTGTAFAEGEPPTPMKPAAELEQLKGMEGNWRCAGKVTVMGKERPSTGTMKNSWELDGHWLVSRFEEKKAKDNPAPHKGLGMMGWSAEEKMFVSMGADNGGMLGKTTSKGWEGDKMLWSGTSKMMGQEAVSQETVTRAGKEMKYVGTVTTGGKPFVSWEMSCKK